jgi:hypothetical protein
MTPARGKDEFAAVSLYFWETIGDSDDGEVQGTVFSWAIPEMKMARTLKEQLCGLLGDPGAELILPWISADAMKAVKTWPGAVKFGNTS